jgi:hypothetical protein
MIRPGRLAIGDELSELCRWTWDRQGAVICSDAVRTLQNGDCNYVAGRRWVDCGLII